MSPFSTFDIDLDRAIAELKRLLYNRRIDRALLDALQEFRPLRQRQMIFTLPTLPASRTAPGSPGRYRTIADERGNVRIFDESIDGVSLCSNSISVVGPDVENLDVRILQGILDAL